MPVHRMFIPACKAINIDIARKHVSKQHGSRASPNTMDNQMCSVPQLLLGAQIPLSGCSLPLEVFVLWALHSGPKDSIL